MNIRKRLIIISVLLLVTVFFHLYFGNPLRAEHTYLTRMFLPLSRFLRSLTEGSVLSFGDILYGLGLATFLIAALVWSINLFRASGNTRYRLLFNGLSLLLFILIPLYLTFTVFWGINYYRKGIAYQMDMGIEKPDSSSLVEINSLLMDKLNAAKQEALISCLDALTEHQLFAETEASYKRVSKHYPFPECPHFSVKSSLWSSFLNQAGFTGYYNPFTGEAQVNTSVPSFLQPFVSCHEVAHQLGYAKEMEANFVGYLAAAHSPDPRFRYSAYLHAFLYANHDLDLLDSVTARIIRRRMSKQVWNDLKEWKRFERDHQNFLEPLFSRFYSWFLKRNNQPEGLKSYNKVTALLIAYRKKYGKI